MPALRQQGFVVLRGADNHFDHLAVKKKRLKDDRPGFSLGKVQKDLSGGGQMDDRQALPPNAGFDIFRVGKSGIENKLGQLIYREPLHPRGELQYLAGQRFSEKGDPHAASDHPIAHAALEGSQVSIALALTA
jgi:hypothetical protein